TDTPWCPVRCGSQSVPGGLPSGNDLSPSRSGDDVAPCAPELALLRGPVVDAGVTAVSAGPPIEEPPGHLAPLLQHARPVDRAMGERALKQQEEVVGQQPVLDAGAGVLLDQLLEPVADRMLVVADDLVRRMLLGKFRGRVEEGAAPVAVR